MCEQQLVFLPSHSTVITRCFVLNFWLATIALTAKGVFLFFVIVVRVFTWEGRDEIWNFLMQKKCFF